MFERTGERCCEISDWRGAALESALMSRLGLGRPGARRAGFLPVSRGTKFGVLDLVQWVVMQQCEVVIPDLGSSQIVVNKSNFKKYASSKPHSGSRSRSSFWRLSGNDAADAPDGHFACCKEQLSFGSKTCGFRGLICRSKSEGSCKEQLRFRKSLYL